MASLEDVLGAAGPIDLTGVERPLGSLTMGHDPDTGLRAFRLVLEPNAEAFASVLQHIDDAEIIDVEIVAYPEPGCRGTPICTEMSPLWLPFATIVGPVGLARECPPYMNDGGAIEALRAKCSCRLQGQGVQSESIEVTVQVYDRRPPPATDVWARQWFRFCFDCKEERE